MDTAALRISINTGDVKTANAELDKLTNTSKKTEKATDGVTSSFISLNKIIAVGSVASLASQYIKLADSMTGMQSKLKLVTSSTQELATAQEELFKIAQKTRQGYAETVDTFYNFAVAMGDMGKSQKEILRVTETVNKAIAISGGTAQQAAAATMQLGQAFASGTLRGDELNSILENSKGLAQAIADGMGVPIGKLRQLGSDGKITAEILATALERSAQSVDDKFSKVGVTVAMSVTQIENSLLQLVGEADQAMNGSGGLSETFSYFSEAMDNNRAEIIESGKDAYRALQVMGVGMIQFGTSFYQAGVAIPTAIALAVDAVTQLMENGINDMIGLAEDGANKVKSIYGGDRVKLGRVDIDTNLSGELLSHYNSIVDAQENAIATQGKLFKDIMDNTTEIKKIAPASDKDGAKKGGGKELTKEQITAAKKAAKEAEKLRLEQEKIQKGYLEGYAELQKDAAIEQYNLEISLLNDKADIEAGIALEIYNSTISSVQKLSDEVVEKYNIAEKLFPEGIPQEWFDSVNKKFEDLNELVDVKDFEFNVKINGLEGVTKGIADIANSFNDMQKAEIQYEKNKNKYVKNSEWYQRNELQFQEDKIANYSNMVGGVASFYSAESTQAKKLADMQKVMGMAMLTMELSKMGLLSTNAMLFSLQAPPPANFAAFAATAALIASLGIVVGSALSGVDKTSTSSDAFSSMAGNTGTGSVLGDASAQSESITNALQIMGDLAKPEFRLTSQMAKSLQSIDAKIGGVTSILMRQAGFAMGEGFEGFDTGYKSKLNVNSGIAGAMNPLTLTDKLLEKIGLGAISGFGTGIVNSILGGLFGKTSVSQTMTDSGIYFADALLQNAIDEFNGSAYQTISTTVSKKSWFSKSSSTTVSTYFAGLNDEVERQFSLVLSQLYDTTIMAGSALDTASSDIESDLSDFVVSIGKISLKGKTGDQIQETLSNIFGKIADDIVMDVFPALIPFQKIGEGLFETMTRVATGMEEAEYYINRLGISFNDVVYSDLLNKQGDVALEALRQSIIELEGTSGGVAEIINNLTGNVEDLYTTYTALDRLRFSLTAIGTTAEGLTSSMLYGAGGIEALDDATQSYIENYLSESEQVAYNTAVMSDAFSDLGLTIPTTKQGFTDLLKSIDVTTEGGQDLYGRLILLSEGFSELVESSDNLKSSLFENIQNFIDKINGELASKDPIVSFGVFTTSFNAMIDAIANGSEDLLDVGNTALNNAQSYLDTVTATATAGRDIAFAKAMLVNKFSGVIAQPDTTLSTINGTLNQNNAVLVSELQALKFELNSLKTMSVDQRATSENQLSTMRAILGEVSA